MFHLVYFDAPLFRRNKQIRRDLIFYFFKRYSELVSSLIIHVDVLIQLEFMNRSNNLLDKNKEVASELTQVSDCQNVLQLLCRIYLLNTPSKKNFEIR